MITTKSIGMDAATADPKPVRHINWTGQPMKEGDNYWGSDTGPAKAESVTKDEPVQRVIRKRRKRGLMSPEAKKAISERMRAYWSGKRSVSETTTISVGNNN